MTPEQAKEQIQRMFVAYPGYRQWLNEQSPDPVGTMETWILKLRPCEYQDVVAVIDEMIVGEIAHKDRFDKRDALADNIRTAAKELEKKRKFKARCANLQVSGRERRYSCPLCLDTGRVEVFHPKYMKHLRTDSEEQYRSGKTCLAACNCEAGEPFQEGYVSKNGAECLPLRRYDASRMCRFNPDSNDPVDTIESWLNQKPKAQQSFDEGF